MNKLSNTKCDVCLRRGVTTKVRTICNECREFLCKECSDTHLLHRSSQNHSLIDLDPLGEESRSASEDELASDFLKQATVSETTVLYRAQVAVESKLHDRKQKDSKKNSEAKSKQNVDITKVKVTKVQEFSVKQPDETRDVYVTGVLTMDAKIIIADHDTKKLKMFDRSGNYLSSTDMDQYLSEITRVDKDKFATCGFGQKVFIWTLSGKTITEKETYHVDYAVAHGIHYNNTYYCVLHHYDNAVTILDSQGRRVREIVMKEAYGKKIEFGRDIHMDKETNNIYVPCWTPDGLLCMSVEGEILWFTPISDAVLWGITEIHGTLCIVNGSSGNQGLHLISKTGQCIGKLLEKEELTGNPHCICYNETEDKIYISYTDDAKREIISVYSLSSREKSSN